MIRDFLWGTFNYRNKGIPLYRWPRVGYLFAKECMKTKGRRQLMNKEYIVEFNIGGNNYILVKINAENNELALNQAQGMIHGEWVNLVDINNNSIRVRSDKIYALSCYRE